MANPAVVGLQLGDVLHGAPARCGERRLRKGRSQDNWGEVPEMYLLAR